METNQMYRRGFSFHELMIMAAFLAIIMASALPTLQTAETRRKVATVRKDLWLYAQAINAYTVDYGRPPVGRSEFQWITPGYPGVNFNAFRSLTTPVAYMSSLPQDPFYVVSIQNQTDYRYNSFAPNPDNSFSGSIILAIRARGYNWLIYSLGPARQETMPWIEDMLLNPTSAQTLNNIYDPTNGTYSPGKIYHTNKGALIPPL